MTILYTMVFLIGAGSWVLMFKRFLIAQVVSQTPVGWGTLGQFEPVFKFESNGVEQGLQILLIVGNGVIQACLCTSNVQNKYPTPPRMVDHSARTTFCYSFEILSAVIWVG